ncbi:MAG TPA: hypothetical protein VE398_08130 [Acidobacteriota bacterium]|nr:hypothetical protein [Acidobacteriota bacterium]
MQTPLPIRVELTEFEQALFDQIDFGGDAGHLAALASGKASRQLMESLIKRNAIPGVRLDYFTKPFPGGRGKSYMEAFRRNLRGRHIFEDSGFVQRFVRYFVFGPDLAKRTIERFCEIAAKDNKEELNRFVRRETRNAGRMNRRKMADDFFKLALECFPDDPLTPERIRNAAMQAR